MTEKPLLNHLLLAVEQAALHSAPFPHLLIRDIFPPSVYAALLKQMPPRAAFENTGNRQKKNVRVATKRYKYRLNDLWLPRLPAESRRLWQDIREALSSDALKEAVFTRLSGPLALRFGVAETETAGIPAFPLPELICDEDGYSITPHPDVDEKIATLQIALPQDDSQAHLGTELYARSRNPWHWLLAPRGFRQGARVPFLPNSAFAFCVLNLPAQKTWHGRSTVRSRGKDRFHLLHFWFQRKEKRNSFLSIAPTLPAVSLDGP